MEKDAQVIISGKEYLILKAFEEAASKKKHFKIPYSNGISVLVIDDENKLIEELLCKNAELSDQCKKRFDRINELENELSHEKDRTWIEKVLGLNKVPPKSRFWPNGNWDNIPDYSQLNS